jgi:alanyl-tRNA synthetase
MTDRLYYTDPYLRAFDATIAAVDRRDDRAVVTLDRTAFYPTSGGQPFDTGMLAGCRVVEVFDREDGSIAHVIDGPTAGLQAGRAVHAEIDWPRRFDHMQQHTGQHLLSAAFDRLFDVRTVSFRLGAALSTIDLTRELTPAEIAAGEDEANRIVWENRTATIRFVTADEAAKLPLRKESLREGTLRLVDVDGFDLSACGGTHVARTGAIGIIAVASWERFKGGQRIEFLCGGRALERFRTLRDTVGGAVRPLSVLPEDLPAAIERLQADAKELKRTVSSLQTELAAFRAEDLAQSAEPVLLTSTATGAAGCRLVLRVIDADANGLKALAMAVASKPGHVVVLASMARPALVAVARSSDVDVSAQKILSSLVSRFGGRGGGKPELAQGGGLDATAADTLAAARQAIGSRSSTIS